MSIIATVGDNSDAGILRHWEKKTKYECAREILRCWKAANSEKEKDKITQVSGFGVANTPNTQCDYMLVGLTESGRVVISNGDGQWADVT